MTYTAAHYQGAIKDILASLVVNSHVHSFFLLSPHHQVLITHESLLPGHGQLGEILLAKAFIKKKKLKLHLNCNFSIPLVLIFLLFELSIIDF